MIQNPLLFFSVILCFYLNGQQAYKQNIELMGTSFDITVVAEDSIKGSSYIQLAVKEIQRIEQLISSWKPDSQTSLINNNAGSTAVRVDKELYQLIERALKISALTDGAFDITYASMDKIWKFDGSMTQMPLEDKIKESIAKVGYKNVVLNAKAGTVFLPIKGMKIGFGAIGKGYAADKAKELLQNNGVAAGIINASGDMNTWGVQPNGEAWKVAITNPLNKKNVFALLPISNGAVVTSGSYEKFVKFKDKRYSHIIDPRTGYPSTGIISVTVFAPKSEVADALATSVFVMGKEVGLDRINQLQNIECILVEESGAISTSKNIKLDAL